VCGLYRGNSNVDRLDSILKAQCLWCDAHTVRHQLEGSTIGMEKIKKQRLQQPLSSYSDLHVGDCVPFYFCPRSIMLYVIYKKNHSELTYQGGQEYIIHLESDLQKVISWATKIHPHQRWIFTTSNAGSKFFEDYCDLEKLDKINWKAIQSNKWSAEHDHLKEGKQAEFLVERSVPWHLFERVGVYSEEMKQSVLTILLKYNEKTKVEIKKDWYY
jgi:hypothetical protein